MKQSELEYWKWNAAETEYVVSSRMARLYPDTPGRRGNEKLFRVAGYANASELTEAARIAEHYEQTGRFGPDEERPTREQVEKWLASRQWVHRQGTNFWRPYTPDNGLYVDSELPSAITAIALLEQRPEAEIVREMLEL